MWSIPFLFGFIRTQTIPVNKPQETLSGAEERKPVSSNIGVLTTSISSALLAVSVSLSWQMENI
uniref:Uncharacterized protein MANES_16G107300 n=1 Tax=Rhizophora mucronata TaxID=61149 RepID=A0A2P2LCE4_RHIMU